MRGTDFIRGSVVAVVLAVGASPAMAYVDSGTDLQGDNSGAVDGVGDYDIRFTTRSVVQGHTERTSGLESGPTRSISKPLPTS
jgi:hypothetical protein